jgi:hypothetical protein
MPSVLGTTADVYEAVNFIANGVTQEIVLSQGAFAPIDDAYWEVSVVPISFSGSFNQSVQVIEQWIEILPGGSRTLHYVVRNRTPSLPYLFFGCTYKRKLVRIPAR